MYPHFRQFQGLCMGASGFYQNLRRGTINIGRNRVSSVSVRKPPKMKHPDATEWLLGNRDRSSEKGLLSVRLKFYPPIL